MRLNLDVVSFLAETESQQEYRIQRAARDVMFFCRTYLPHYFTHSPDPFQYELVKLLENSSELVVPQEFAKSTLYSFGYVLHQICFGKRHFIIIGSDTEDLASDLTGYIYLELLYNDRIRQDFGEQVKNNCSVNDFVTINDIRVKARGQGQRLRSLKHRRRHPDLVILQPEKINSPAPWKESKNAMLV